MPKKAKKKDFDKKKLRVGKTKAAPSNATDTSFVAKSINVPLQTLHTGSSTQSHINLTRHHTAIARKQAVVNLESGFHTAGAQQAQILTAIAPLVVDDDRTVRQALLKFLGGVDPAVLAPFVSMFLLYIHSAMTHISPAIRSEATLYLDLLLKMVPKETARLGFAKSLQLFFPLLGWTAELSKASSQAGVVATTMGFGKSAAKTKLVHLTSLQRLIAAALEPETDLPPVLYHEDTHKFLVPTIFNPFATVHAALESSSNQAKPGTATAAGILDHIEERRAFLDTLSPALAAGLAGTVKEGGEIGRVAAKVAQGLAV